MGHPFALRRLPEAGTVSDGVVWLRREPDLELLRSEARPRDLLSVERVRLGEAELAVVHLDLLRDALRPVVRPDRLRGRAIPPLDDFVTECDSVQLLQLPRLSSLHDSLHRRVQ
jgi:hypothetical protein